jgi:hypothetical protein
MTADDPFTYVLCWKYPDNSSFGVVATYEDKPWAEKDLAMLIAHSDTKVFWIETAEHRC